MKYIRYALLALILVACVTVSFANRQPVELALWPQSMTDILGFGLSITLPLFVVVVGAVGAGLVIGLLWEWLRERRIRVEAAHNRRELDRLRASGTVPATTAPQPQRDKVLAILDEADA